MGRITEDITVTVTLSDHNDERDAADRALAQDLAARIRAIATEPKFGHIVQYVPERTPR